ncbi:MAG: 1-deoxy-D-xylulose-5-phosphate reductoisomerase [Phycisphaerae bacterium]|nr:1-deoxy-D-xylulose-5-phosphate reductoisomerase [Phycisphaerae bacterium]
MQRRLLILGSTGSIGESALDVAAALGPSCRVVGLGARRRWREMAEQIRRFAVHDAALSEDDAAESLRGASLNGTRIRGGSRALVELVEQTDADFVLSAIVGAAGLPATLAAVERGLTIGLANKESLVVAGSILMPLAERTGSKLLPVDSEHSAVFQALRSGRREEVRRVVLTASGGPFRSWERSRIEHATVAEALKHPTWQMGPKITIDSATMMNKALEVIEACWLFQLPPEQVEVVVHPESIVHSMVEFCDGSIIAQLGAPDMRTPIQYALTYPLRADACGERLNWSELRQLNFSAPDLERFPCLSLGYEAARRGGNAGAVLNASNEVAVEAFLEGRIRFGDIHRLAARSLQTQPLQRDPTLDELLACDARVRQEVRQWIC